MSTCILYTAWSGDMDAPIAARTAWSQVGDGWWLLDVDEHLFPRVHPPQCRTSTYYAAELVNSRSWECVETSG